MSLPEISRRCLSCGGAVRAGARFCPQCGVPMGTEVAQAAGEAWARPAEGRADVDGDAGQQARAESVAPEPLEAEASREWTPPMREFSAFVQSLESDEPQVAAEKLAEKREVAGPPATGPGAEASAGPLASGPTGVDAGDAARLAADAPHVAGDIPQVADNSQVAAARPRVTGEGPSVTAAGMDSAEDMRARVARVREGTRARVGKMREEALVVLEETPDDSGLRFVVAAAALFFVFLFLLFLSTTVLR